MMGMLFTWVTRGRIAVGLFALLLGLPLGAIALGQEGEVRVSPGQARLDDALELLHSGQGLDIVKADAEAALMESLIADPKLGLAHYNLAVLYYRTGQIARAMEALEAAVNTVPRFGDGYALMALIEKAAGRSDKAKPLFEKALAVDKMNAFAHNQLAREAIGNREWKEAIRHGRMALVDDPENLNAYHNVATAYYELARTDLALLVCHSALSIDPQNAPMHNLLGLVLLAADDVRGALASFREALRLDPQSVDALLNAGSVTLSFMDYASALEFFERAAELQPDGTAARLSQAVALRGLERYDESEAVYQALLARDAGHLSANYNLCILFNEHKVDYAKALEQCRRFESLIGDAHEKKAEMARRVQGIAEIIEAQGAE